MEDAKIVELFWERKECAIQAASDKYNSFCFRIAYKILYSREDSEECVNDTWFAAWRYIPPKKPSVLSAFLGRITRGFAIDCLRKKSAEKTDRPAYDSHHRRSRKSEPGDGVRYGKGG